jgi:hypothetical protein
MSRPDSLSVLVCRGCCCGTDKHPQVDHAAQLEALRAAALSHGSARLWEVDCLGPCSSSNVVVVRTGTARRWFGQMLDPRDTAVLAEWIHSGATTLPPPRIAARQFDPDPTIGAIVEPLVVSGGDLADLVFDTLITEGGSWSMGVHGAIAEFVPDTHTSIRRTGPTIEAVGPTGSIRLTVDDRIRAFTTGYSSEPSTVVSVILGTTRPHSNPAASKSPQIGIDPEPIRSGDKNSTYFDLNIGHHAATFAVRTTDPELIATLRICVGLPWTETIERYGQVIAANSPHRVVTGAAGRVEIYAPIPQPGGRPPRGSHTHLLPAELELGRELPLGIVLPPGLMPAATFRPGPGWDWDVSGRWTGHG